jgi:hypothetical protein
MIRGNLALCVVGWNFQLISNSRPNHFELVMRPPQKCSTDYRRIGDVTSLKAKD